MSRRRTKAQQEKPIAEIKEAAAKWNAMSRRKRYVFIAIGVLTVLAFAFVVLASYVKNGSSRGILEYEGRAE
jgi:type II secretory pathway component PulM